jgi:hypothetical protein
VKDIVRKLDRLAGELEKRNYAKLAYTLDVISNTIEDTSAYWHSPAGLAKLKSLAKQIGTEGSLPQDQLDELVKGIEHNPLMVEYIRNQRNLPTYFWESFARGLEEWPLAIDGVVDPDKSLWEAFSRGLDKNPEAIEAMKSDYPQLMRRIPIEIKTRILA